MSNQVFSFFGTIGLKTQEAEQGLKKITEKAKETATKIGSSFSGISKGVSQGITNITNKARKALSNIASSFTGISKRLSSAFTGIASGMSSAMSSIGSMASSVGSSLNNYITKPALAAATALAAITLKKGWGRINTIDEATVKLKALGLTGEEVTQIYNNANDAVTGTAHGLDEAFNVASQAAASGVKSGQEMETYLRRVADAAAFSGVNMDEMGSIFNKVLTGGVAQADELNQMADRGVPIFQMLADVMGVNVEEVKALAAEGAITDDIFMEAFDNIEGYAKNSADTVKGAWSLVMSSLGRIGANLFGQFNEDTAEVEGGLATIKDALTAVRDILVPLEAIAKDVGTALNEALEGPVGKLKEFAEGWGGLDQETQTAKVKSVAAYGAMAVGAGPLLMLIGKLASGFGGVAAGIAGTGPQIANWAAGIGTAGGKVNGLMTNLGLLGQSFTGLASIVMSGAGAGAILAVLGLVYQTFGDEIDGILDMMTEKGPEVITNFVDGILSKLPTLIESGATLLTNLLNAITANLPAIIEGGVQIIVALVQGFIDNLPMIMEASLTLITTLITAIVENLPMLLEAGLQLLVGIITGILENLDTLIPAILQLITTLTTTIIEYLPLIIEAGLQIIMALIQGLWENRELIRASVIDMLTTIGESFLTTMQSIDWAGMWNLIVEAFQTHIIPAIENLVQVAVQWFQDMKTKLGEKVSEIVTNLRTKFEEAKETVTEKVKGMFDAVKEWFGKIPDKISELWGQAQSFLEGINLYDIGKNIIDGLWNGLKGAWNSVSNWISEKANSISGLWESALSIFSPSRVMRDDIGHNIMTGLLYGLEDVWPKITGFMNKATDYIAGADFTAPDVGMGADYTFKQSHQTTVSTRGMMEETNYLLRKLLQKDTDLIINGRVLSEEILDDINELNDIYSNRNLRIQGGSW